MTCALYKRTFRRAKYLRYYILKIETQKERSDSESMNEGIDAVLRLRTVLRTSQPWNWTPTTTEGAGDRSSVSHTTCRRKARQETVNKATSIRQGISVSHAAGRVVRTRSPFLGTTVAKTTAEEVCIIVAFPEMRLMQEELHYAISNCTWYQSPLGKAYWFL